MYSLCDKKIYYKNQGGISNIEQDTGDWYIESESNNKLFLPKPLFIMKITSVMT